MAELSARKEITVIREGERRLTDDEVVVEAPLTIYLNGRELVTLLCTPDKLESLALGFLRSEGLLNSLDDVAALRLRDDRGAVEVELKNKGGLLEKLYGRRTITSGCGKGTIFYSALDALRSSPVRGDSVTLTAGEVHALMRELQERATLFKATGGVHAAALAGGGKILIFCEDIGRHNAVDKIIGECLRQGMAMEDKVLVCSGRLSSEDPAQGGEAAPAHADFAGGPDHAEHRAGSNAEHHPCRFCPRAADEYLHSPPPGDRCPQRLKKRQGCRPLSLLSLVKV